MPPNFQKCSLVVVGQMVVFPAVESKCAYCLYGSLFLSCSSLSILSCVHGSVCQFYPLSSTMMLREAKG